MNCQVYAKVRNVGIPLFLAFLVLFPVITKAQIWDVTLNINPFPSPYVSDWENNPTAVGQATIENRTDNGEEVELFVTVFKSDIGQLLESVGGKVFVQPNSMKTLNNTDFIRFSSADFTNSSIEEQVFRTGRLPEGTYTACVQVRNLGGANFSPQRCQNFEIVYPDPPQLITPIDKNSVTTEFPTFQWIPVNVPPQFDVFYTLKIVEVLETQTALRALEANVPVFERNDITSTTFIYPIDGLSFKDDISYAWQVQAVDQFGLAPASNQGRSEIFEFKFKSADKDTTEDDKDEEEEDIAERETPPGPCIDDCTVDAPSDTEPDSQPIAVGATLKMGRFVLTVTNLSSSAANSLSGNGVVEIPFFRSNIRVEFEGLKVNKAGEVFEGEAKAKVEPASGISTEIISKIESNTDLDDDEIGTLQQAAAQSERLVSSFSSSDTVSLPIGFDQTINGRNFVIGVYGMNFEPTGANVTTGFEIELPELGPDMNLNFQQKACFHPNGLGNKIEMFLADDFGYTSEDSWSFVFKAGSDSESAASGTHVKWGCEGFEEVFVKAEVEFPRDWFKPYDEEDGGSDKAKATFESTIKDGSGWIASANMDRVKISGASGFGMEINDMVFDFSDALNPEDISFPSGYEGITGVDWKGFHIKSASLIMPSKFETFEGSPPEVGVNDLIIDNSGFTAGILVENVIRGETGNFGGWAGSIDEIGLNFVNSSLRDGQMKGGIKLPISDEKLDYEALLSVVHESDGGPSSEVGNLEYAFTIKPEEDYNVPMWAAELTLDNSTYISLVDTSETRGFEVEANLTGTLSISGEVGDAAKKIPMMNFEGIEFSELQFMNREPYFEIGSWSFASPQKGMGGFPVSIDNIRPVSKFTEGNPSLGLGFDLSINLMDETISGTAGLAIYGKLNITGPGPVSAEFDGVDLEKIEIKAELSAVEIDGSIEFYDGDATYGNGFKGSLEATFLEEITVSATAQFGSVDDYRYWYVDARAGLGSAGISMGVVSLYGFGGGAWYHMRRTGSGPVGVPAQFAEAEAEDSNEPGTTNSGYRFVPDKDIDLGVKALVTLGLSGNDAMFNADVELVVIIEDGTLGEVSLSGKFFMLADVPNRDRAILNGAAEFKFVVPDKTFTGVFDINFDLTPFEVQIQMDLLFSPDDWHVMIGRPDGEVASADLGFADLSVNAYFMTGTDIPGIPDPPAFFGVSRYSVGEYAPEREPEVSSGKGFAFGANASLDTGDLEFLIFFARLRGEVGFDFSLMKKEEGCINWRDISGLGPGEPPGWSGWYGEGQVYAYVMLKAGVKIKLFRTRKITLIKAELGALLQGKGPKPTWMMGVLKGRFTVLRAIKVNFRFKAEIGTKCELPTEHPLDEIGLEIISDMTPQDAEDGVDVYAVPQVAFNMPVGRSAEPLQIEEFDEVTFETNVRFFRALLKDFTITKDGDSSSLAESRIKVEEDGSAATLYPRDMLSGESGFEVTAEVIVEELINGSWVKSRDPATGELYTQSKSVTFETGPAPDVIEEENVAYTYPITRQRYFLQGEASRGEIVLKRGFPDSESNPLNVTSEKDNHQMRYVARFIAIDGGVSELATSTVTYNQGRRTVFFDLPDLQNEKIYSVQIVRMEVDTSTAGRLAALLPQGINNNQAITNDVVSSTIRERLAYTRAGASVTISERKLPGTTVKANEKLLYQFYFRTSRYDTFSEKISNVDLTTVEGSKFGIFQSNILKFRSEEGFDEFDLQGKRFNRDGQNQTFGPLVQVTAKERTTFWHIFYANLQVYDKIEWLQQKSPLPPIAANRRVRGYVWRWNGLTNWERADRRNDLAEFRGEGRFPLSEGEVQRAGIPDNQTQSSGSSSPFSNFVPRTNTTPIGNSSGFGGTSFNFSNVDIDSRYPLDVTYKHGIYVPLDYFQLRRQAGTVLREFTYYLNFSPFIIYRLSNGDKFRLQRILSVDYIPISSEQHQVKFYFTPMVTGTSASQVYLNTAQPKRIFNFQYIPE